MNRSQFVFALFLAAVAANPSALATDILTNRGDLARTGLNSSETILNPGNVGSPAFGLLYQDQVDGQLYAQPLYVSQQRITPTGGQPRVANVLYVATEHDSLYAFDADTGTQYWQTSLLSSGESPVSSNDVGCTAIQPEIGITSTPIIDRTMGANGTIFVLAFSKNNAGTSFVHRLHAIDLSTGQNRLTPAVIAASTAPVNRPANTFTPIKQLGRAGLLLLNGIVYTCWASYCDSPPYTGWIIGYHESNLTRAIVLNTDPNGSPASSDLPDGSGNTIWQSGNAPSVDGSGNIYVATANGPFSPSLADYGDSVLRLAPGSLAVADYFTPFDQFDEATNDIDLGSAGPVLLPDIVDSTGTHHRLLVQSGKNGNLYLLNRDSLGKFNPNNNNQIYQELPNALPGGVWSSAAYFNGSIYQGSRGGPISQFQFNSQAKLNSAPASSTNTTFDFPGATPTISSNGNSNGIVWAYENNSGQAVLHAYDARNLGAELFQSGNLGGAVKFVVPTVCNGKVFVGTANSVAAFGLPSTSIPGSGVADDFNNDGKADLLLENSATGKRAIWYLSDGIFQSSSALPTLDPQWHIAGSTDFLGNDQANLILENTSTGQHMVWILSNGIYVSTITLPTIPNQWHISGIAGVAGNSRKNVVLENTDTGRHIVWVLDNGAYSFTVALPTVGPQWHITGVADAPTNNQAQVILENSVTGHHVLWVLTNGAYSFTIALPAVSPQWHVAAAADFLGNGQADIVLENTATGHHVLWILNNGSYSFTIALPTVGSRWKVAGAADFLGNGQAGIALQNTITGQRMTWILINGGYSHTNVLPTVSPQWNIVEH